MAKSIFRKRGFFRGESLEERNVFLSLLKTREIHGVWISWWREKFLFAPNKLFQVLLASMLGQSVANAPRLENTSPVPLLKAGFAVTRIRRERGAHGRSARRVSVLALLPTLFVIIPSPEGLLLVILEQKRQKRTIFVLNFCGTHTAPLLPCSSSSELKSDFRLHLCFLEYLPSWKLASRLTKCGILVE